MRDKTTNDDNCGAYDDDGEMKCGDVDGYEHESGSENWTVKMMVKWM